MVFPSSSSKHKETPENPTNPIRPYSKAATKEDRRRRGEIACAECRRLKVRCDRQIPCSTCVSRGCMALCPNGVLPPGDNSRFVEKSKAHYEKQLVKMKDRIRALEDAITIAQAAETNEPHPLLSAQWRLEDESDEEPEDEAEDHSKEDPWPDSLVQSFGTLHVNERERTMRFFGPAGSPESLLVGEGSLREPDIPSVREDDSLPDLLSLGLPEELWHFYHAFPLAPPIGLPRAPARELIESFLPSRQRAEELSRCFLNHLSWMFQIVTYQQLTESLMPPFYPQAHASGADIPEGGPHDLALLLIVFAVGALVDLSLPPYNVEAQRYHVLARAALALAPFMEKASMATIKTLHLISIFNGMSGKESNLANTYTILNLAGRVAQRIGLHIDPSHWNMSADEIYHRRTYFWNLLRADMIQSLGTGRPPAVADSWHWVQIPSEEEEKAYQEKEIAVLGFGIWGFKHDRECMLPVLKIVMAAKPPSYQAVLELDRKIRDFKPPLEASEEPDSPNISISMRSWVRSHFKEVILMSLHRGFFARAISGDFPDPLSSPYRFSVLAAYKCAVRILSTTSEQFRRQPNLLSRIWMIWSLNFASALIVGAIAARMQDVALDPPPLEEFERACTLFRKASKTNSRAAAALPVLLTIREKALQQYHGTAPPGRGGPDPSFAALNANAFLPQQSGHMGPSTIAARRRPELAPIAMPTLLTQSMPSAQSSRRGSTVGYAPQYPVVPSRPAPPPSLPQQASSSESTNVEFDRRMSYQWQQTYAPPPPPSSRSQTAYQQYYPPASDAHEPSIGTYREPPPAQYQQQQQQLRWLPPETAPQPGPSSYPYPYSPGPSATGTQPPLQPQLQVQPQQQQQYFPDNFIPGDIWNSFMEQYAKPGH